MCIHLATGTAVVQLNGLSCYNMLAVYLCVSLSVGGKTWHPVCTSTLPLSGQSSPVPQN